MAEKSVAVAPQKETSAKYEETRQPERYLTPPVDIYETSEGLTVVADVAGVSRDGVNVRVDDNVLTIECRVDGCDVGQNIYREYELANYFRQFELTDEVDQERIDAELKNGVLTIRLPKKEAAKPKQIEVKVS